MNPVPPAEAAGTPPAGGTSPTTLNFHAPVGEVVAYEINGEMPPGLLPPTHVTERAPLAPALIDRGSQIDPLLDRLASDAEVPGSGKMLIIVPGGTADMHEALVLRCAKIEFATGNLGRRPWRYLKELRWPEGASSVNRILKSINDAAALPRSDDCAVIEAQIAGLGTNLCFSHFVDGPLWADDGGALVRAWVDYFREGRLAAAAGHMLVAFLCIELQDPRSPSCRELEEFLASLSASAAGESGASVLVTQPLGPIMRRHMRQWVSDASTYLGEDFVQAALLDLPAALFPDNAPSKPMAAVYQPVERALAEAIWKFRRPPQFLETHR